MAENNQKTVIRHGGWQKIIKKLPSSMADGRKTSFEFQRLTPIYGKGL
ncbi:hypothetical protein HMPREF0658_1918 [Hoylesella marshii DSM 16973 = JCM 13450]|uniref:Uncharacterized protein n=1 Tax=Hoylesella marshii DSM 16973 = JCM 13450 TaxID=862515 RepID=E0NUR3_9BACT|nr:hypothetical protein HMPREF0658_1918 [Hoylesella marshii DSM 16973 = JCM 13450]